MRKERTEAKGERVWEKKEGGMPTSRQKNGHGKRGQAVAKGERERKLPTQDVVVRLLCVYVSACASLVL